jgi:predicted TIM-barrel fold metal-dependent hydrolase
MIIDFHTHIFPPYFRSRHTDFFSSEPAFEWLYSHPKSRIAGREELLKDMDEEDIQKSVIFGFPWENEEYFRRHNDYIMESVQKHPDRLVGFCCCSPMSPHASAETERCLEGGLSGVGELAVYHKGGSFFHLHGLRDIFGICRRFDVPILLHTNEPVGQTYPGKTSMTLREIYDLISQFPQNRIVLAHWGGGLLFYALMKKEVRKVLENVWFDTAASPYLYLPAIYRVAGQTVGFEKILLGSDYPLLRPGRYFLEMNSVNLSKRSFKKIVGENALRLLGLTGRNPHALRSPSPC